MLIYVFWALLLTLVTVSLHGVCTVILLAIIRKLSLQYRKKVSRRVDHLFLLARLVVGLLFVHCLEAVIWATYYLADNRFANLETALYFSLTSYTTIGYGDVVLGENIRLVGAIEGLAGTFMCGWSVALLVSVTQFIIKMDYFSADMTPEDML